MKTVVLVLFVISGLALGATSLEDIYFGDLVTFTGDTHNSNFAQLHIGTVIDQSNPVIRQDMVVLRNGVKIVVENNNVFLCSAAGCVRPDIP